MNFREGSILLIGNGAYKRALARALDSLFGFKITEINWNDLSLGKVSANQRAARFANHVVLAPPLHAQADEIRFVHDTLWSKGSVNAASCALLIPSSERARQIAEMDVFGNTIPGLSFQHLVHEEKSHRLLPYGNELVALLEWFEQGGIMLSEDWSSAKRRYSRLLSLKQSLEDGFEDKSQTGTFSGNLPAIRQMTREIAWDNLGGPDAHIFKRRIDGEILLCDFPSDKSLRDLLQRLKQIYPACT